MERLGFFRVYVVKVLLILIFFDRNVFFIIRLRIVILVLKGRVFIIGGGEWYEKLLRSVF